MSEETTWLDRLKAEAQELAERCDKLHAFIQTAAFRELPPIQSWLLPEQLRVMQEYRRILGLRITQATIKE